MPNRFWPDTTATRSTGNQIQQNTAANNPDVFCESQGSGYRLPSAGEFNSGNRGARPWANSESKEPGHWSNYSDNSITGQPLSPKTGRLVSGSLANEWGDLTKYSGGWDPNNYWATEPSIIISSSGFSSGRGIGRYIFGATTGAVNLLLVSTTSSTPDISGRIYSVACVRDLVPTPSTPNPGKS